MGVVKDIQTDLEIASVKMMTECRSRLLVYALRICGNPTDAEDLVGSAFKEFFAHIEGYDSKKGELYPYLKGILDHLHARTKRRAVNRGTVAVDPSVLESDETLVTTCTEDEILANSDHDALRAAIGRLPPKSREVILLHYFSELPVAKVARVLGISGGTVKWRLNMARKALATDLGRTFDCGKKPLAVILVAFLSLVSAAAVATLPAFEPLRATVAGWFGASVETPVETPFRAAEPTDQEETKTNEQFEVAREESQEMNKITNVIAAAVSATVLSMNAAAAESTAPQPVKTMAVKSAAPVKLAAANDVPLALPSTAYVQDGLAAQWDGIDNAGRGEHVESSAIRQWPDLVGTNKIVFSSNVKVEGGKAMKMGYRGMGTCEMLATSEEVTVEVRGMTTTQKATTPAQYYFSNMVASIGLEVVANGLYVSYPTGESTVNTLHGTKRDNFFNSYRTFSLCTQTGGYSFYLNGAPYTADTLGSEVSSTGVRGSEFMIFGAGTANAFQDQSIRLYSRQLTPEERKVNYLVDNVRFASGTLPKGVRLSPEGTRLQARITIRPRGEGITLDGVMLTDDYDEWVEVGTKMTLAVSPAAGRRVGWGGFPDATEFSEDGLTATFRVALPHCLGVNVFAPTHVWTGAADGVFSNDGNWATADGAATTAPSGAEAIVYVPSGAPSMTIAAPINVGALYVGSLTNGADKISVEFQHAQTNVVAGDVAVYCGATLTHAGLATTISTLAQALANGAGIVLSAGGDLAVFEGATVSAVNKGFTRLTGPGTTTAGGSGAGHASRSAVFGAEKGQTYGSILSPIYWGSGGAGTAKGGGVVRIMAQETMTIGGTVSVDSGANTDSGAAGSAWLTCGVLAGWGTITANGGNSTKTSAGSGGRIALVETAAEDFSRFAGTVEAGFSCNISTVPAGSRGGAGTIYRKAKNVNEVSVSSSVEAPASYTDFPMPDDGNARKCYSETAFVGEKNVTYFLTANTTIFDLDLRSASAKIDLNGHTLKIRSNEHRDGKGWGGDLENLVIRNGGKIVWSAGLVFMIR